MPYKARLLRQVLSCSLQSNWEPAPWNIRFHSRAALFQSWEMCYHSGSPIAAFIDQLNATALLPLYEFSSSSFIVVRTKKLVQTMLPLFRATMSTVFLTVGQYFNLAAITMTTRDSLSPDTLFYQRKIQLHGVIYQAHSLQSDRISPDRTKINLLENSSWERTNGISLSLRKLVQTVLYHKN